MTITTTIADNALILSVAGRIDTTTSPQLQSALLDAFKTQPHIELDFASVDYVSSAGLRAFLIGQKTATAQQGSMALSHVSAPVLEILTSVGFSKILTIR